MSPRGRGWLTRRFKPCWLAQPTAVRRRPASLDGGAASSGNRPSRGSTRRGSGTPSHSPLASDFFVSMFLPLWCRSILFLKNCLDGCGPPPPPGWRVDRKAGICNFSGKNSCKAQPAGNPPLNLQHVGPQNLVGSFRRCLSHCHCLNFSLSICSSLRLDLPPLGFLCSLARCLPLVPRWGWRRPARPVRPQWASPSPTGGAALLLGAVAGLLALGRPARLGARPPTSQGAPPPPPPLCQCRGDAGVSRVCGGLCRRGATAPPPDRPPPPVLRRGGRSPRTCPALPFPPAENGRRPRPWMAPQV